ncbi:MAG: hypothetical protein ACM3QS_05250 [Bacteroidota bacterium]
MDIGERIKGAAAARRRFPLHGWIGVALALLFWVINWSLSGPRTHLGFFPMWLGYCLAVDGAVLSRTGTSLLSRSVRRYVGLFVLSAPMWWIFELLNLRTQNWVYEGAAQFSPGVYFLLTTVSFTTVLPAVLESAELLASFDFLKRPKQGPMIGVRRRTVLAFFLTGWIMLALLLLWPKTFFLFVWVSLYFITEPINIWLGNRSLTEWTRDGDWRPVLALWLGILLTAFFWEMWNYLSYPKWVYHVAWGNWLHVFEMPLLGYGGYLPFSLELYALYHLACGLLGEKHPDYIRIAPEAGRPERHTPASKPVK